MSGLSAAEILTRAADLLERPGAWTQGVYARDAHGKGVSTADPQAACFCASGALWRAEGSLVGSHLNAAHLLLKGVLPKRFDSIAEWNDDPSRAQPEVVAALRKAAALAKANPTNTTEEA